jgi:hypothetical protein
MSTACSEIKYSFSSWLLDQIGGVEKTDPFFVIAGKSIAMLPIAPIALIEAAVRGVFAVLATPLALLLPPSDLRERYQQHIFSPLALGCLNSLQISVFTSVGACITLVLSITQLFKNLISSDEKTVKTPPSIWCCCTKQKSTEIKK